MECKLGKKTVSIIVLMLMLLTIDVAFNIEPVKAGTITVPDDYPTIQEAIDVANPRDTIFVKAGTYHERLLINKGITIVGERQEVTIIDGEGNGTVVEITADGVNLTGFTIANCSSELYNAGIRLDSVKGCSIIGNIITANGYVGVYLTDSSNNIISRNNMTNNWACISLEYSCGNFIVNNNIKANNYGGISIFYSGNNTISRNFITLNKYYGIDLTNSGNNTIFDNKIAANIETGVESYRSDTNIIIGNLIADNWRGVQIQESNNNIFYHNNFIDNSEQVYDNSWLPSSGISPSNNTWDNGYPSGGNYWSDQTGIDLYSGPFRNETGSDGIGDATYTMDVNNNDRYPLMAPFSAFDAGIWNGTVYNVDIISNSSLSNFNIDTYGKTVSFNVTGEENQTGFCRITIPDVIVEDLWQGNHTVLLNGEPWPYRNWTDTANTYIYLNYTHSEHQIVIIPEFPSTVALLVFLVLITIPLIFIKKKHNRKTKS